LEGIRILQLTGLAGKVAVVTGAARMRSIGRATAVVLARAGCDLVITGTSRPAESFPDDEKRAAWNGLESVAEEVGALGQRCVSVVTDRLDEQTADRLVAEIIWSLGGADILVNNAAAPRGADRVPIVDLEMPGLAARDRREPHGHLCDE
jgi:3-oxoacyl-[acyl-carrier protein] reductase